MSLLSIVVPVYNVEKYLNDAISCLLNQTFEDFKTILVDDGSIDFSGSICDEILCADDRMVIVHKKNGGLASARNAGMTVVCSNYIAFMDADDYFSTHFVRIAIENLKHYQPDGVVFGWQYVTSDGVQPPQLTGLPKSEILDKTYIHDKIIPRLININNDFKNFIFDFVWNKIYKTEIIRRNHILFDEQRRIWEDRIFVVEYLKNCDNYFCIGEPLYNYVQVEGSLSSKYYLNFFDIILDNYNKYFMWFADDYDFDNQYSNNYWCNAIENMVFRSLDEVEYQERIKKNILKVFKNNTVSNWYKKRTPKNRFEKNTCKLMINEKYQELLKSYEVMHRKLQRKKHREKLRIELRKKVKNLLK